MSGRNACNRLLLSILLALLAGAGCVQPASPPGPTSIPTPQNTLAAEPAPTTASAAIGTPTALPIDTPVIVTLSAAEVQGLTHPGIRSAVTDLVKRVEEEPETIQIVLAEQVTWSDSSLGCPEPGMLYAQVLTTGIWLVLSHQGQAFDYRVTDNSGALCTQAQQQEPLERRPLAGIWSTLAPMPTPRSEVVAAL